MGIDQKTSYFKLTKLHRPSVGRDYVHRQSLLDKLSQSIDRPFTLVSAPAGYGKSTLISSWLDLIDIPAAWLFSGQSMGKQRCFDDLVLWTGT